METVTWIRQQFAWIDEPAAVLLAALIALVGSLAGGWWAATRLYYRQRWWDRRMDTYASLITNFGTMHHAYSRLVEAHTNQWTLDEKFKQRLLDDALNARTQIQVIARSAGFFITPLAGAAIEAFLERQHEADAPHDELLWRDMMDAKACMEKVIQEARTDLNLPK